MPLTALVRMIRPITLSRGLEIVRHVNATNGSEPDHFDRPVQELIEQVGDIPIGDVTPDHLAVWLKHLRNRDHASRPGQKLSPYTVNYYARAMRAFWNHLVEMGHVDRSPARQMRLRKLPKKRKKELSQDEIARLVEASQYDLRNHAVILVLRDSGCRVGELCSMRAEGVMIREDDDGRLHGRAMVHGDKMSKSRWVYFGSRACRAIRAYLRSRPPNAPDALWLSKRSNKAIGPAGIRQAIRSIGDRAGVDSATPHAFRHAFAKRLQNEGAPARLIQELLGHEDVTTTLQMYITYDDEELAAEHRRFLPGDEDAGAWFI